jgi:hypothetical protein
MGVMVRKEDKEEATQQKKNCLAEYTVCANQKTQTHPSCYTHTAKSKNSAHRSDVIYGLGKSSHTICQQVIRLFSCTRKQVIVYFGQGYVKKKEITSK